MINLQLTETLKISACRARPFFLAIYLLDQRERNRLALFSMREISPGILAQTNMSNWFKTTVFYSGGCGFDTRSGQRFFLFLQWASISFLSKVHGLTLTQGQIFNPRLGLVPP